MSTRRIALAVAAALVGIGFAAGAAQATGGGGEKEIICHPKEGGYTKVNVSQKSVHFDDYGKPKHEHDGRVDLLVEGDACPGDPIPTVTVTLPTSTVTVPGPEVTVTGPDTTVTLPGSTTTVPGPEVTVTGPGSTVTLPGSTTTLPGKVVTVAGKTSTVTGEPLVRTVVPTTTVTGKPLAMTGPDELQTKVGWGAALLAAGLLATAAGNAVRRRGQH